MHPVRHQASRVRRLTRMGAPWLRGACWRRKAGKAGCEALKNRRGCAAPSGVCPATKGWILWDSFEARGRECGGATRRACREREAEAVPVSCFVGGPAVGAVRRHTHSLVCGVSVYCFHFESPHRTACLGCSKARAAARGSCAGLGPHRGFSAVPGAVRVDHEQRPFLGRAPGERGGSIRRKGRLQTSGESV